MPYYMNRDKLDRYMLTRPRNICPKTALNTYVRHYSVRKRQAREFHGSGLISNHVNFAREVEVSTIATTKAGEEYSEESKIESQTSHNMDVFSVEFVVQFFWERLRTTFFLAKSANSQKLAIRWQFRASRYRRGSRLTMQEWMKKPNEYPNYPKSQTLKSFR